MKRWEKALILVVCSIVLMSSMALAGCIFRTGAAKSAVKNLLTYQKYNQWDEVWEMLHPDSQAIWGDKETFVETIDNPSSNLKTFELGRAKAIPSWTFQGNNKTYYDVVEIPATLIHSTTYGDAERSTIIHAVNADGEWKFFHERKK